MRDDAVWLVVSIGKVVGMLLMAVALLAFSTVIVHNLVRVVEFVWART